jgi:hypothetical protein
MIPETSLKKEISMSTFKRLIGSTLFVLVLAGMALAQENRALVENAAKPDVLLVTATAAADRIRFVSPGTVVQLRLEIYNEAGQKIFDTELRGGNVLDWHLQDGSGQRLPPGSYACVLTIKSLSGRLSQRVGVVALNGERASVAPIDTAQLSPAQQQTIGPVESDGGFTVRPQDEAEDLTVVAHDGADGQVARTTGALSFRLGDFLSGNDKEQMRLTAEGNLGIGTDKPQAKLDVAGSIRTAKGIEFSDGTVQTTGLSGRKDSEGNLVPNVSGTGTQNRLAKWLDNSGTLGDSLLSEAGGNIVNNGTNIQMTAAPSAGVDTNLIFVNANDRTTGMIASATPAFSANNGPYFAMRGNTYSSIPGQRGLFSLSTGNVASPTGNDGTMVFLTGADQVRMVIKPSGDIGVGTTTPGTKFDVVGNINTSTQYNIGGNRVFSITGTSNTFVGRDAGNSNTTGVGNSFFGSGAGFSNTTGSSNAFFGGAAGFNNTTGSGNSFFGGGAASSNTTGGSNSFFGSFAGSNNSTGSSNSFFGDTAGSQNTTGGGNSFFGQAAGFMNTTAGNNSTFGFNAGYWTTTGQSNSFFGSMAGNFNSTGGGNSFVGTDAGFANGAGNFNSFFGNQAGRNNTASNNSFFGQNAGFSNTTGTFNSFFGLAAGFANNEGFYNSFFGYRAGASTFGPTASANSFFGNQAGEGNTSGNNNSFFGASAGQFNSTGSGNSFFGSTAGYFNSTGINNSFFGIEAGLNNTASANSFFGFSAGRANVSGNDNVFVGGFTGQANTTGSDNTFVGRGAGAFNTEGSFNSFFGAFAGQNNTTSCCNSFFGVSAGHDNTTGTNNSFFGVDAGAANVTNTDNSYFGRSAGAVTVANNNSFFGSLAGDVNTMGGNNAFFGANAGGSNTNGSNNSFFGEMAASANSTGSGNIVIGSVAGLNLVTGNNNIYLANAGAEESSTIRIGTEGTQTATFIAGINGVNVNPSNSVVVNSSGQLGIIVSSLRYKKDIRSMGDASSNLMRLRPVTFLYRPEYAAGDKTLQYGLIAEEVAKVYPDLVSFGTDGKPQTVRYHLLSTMLLNEVQKQESHILSQAQQLKSQAQQIADLEARLRRLESRLLSKRRR